jgi:acetyl-CoA carboxylase biotin carboxyl carrier protein
VEVIIGKGAPAGAAAPGQVGATHAVASPAPGGTALGAPASAQPSPAASAAAAAPVAAAAPAQTSSAASATAPSRKPAASTASAPAGTIDIKAQIMGMFYAQPEPGAPPFVSVGAQVKKDTTVCLIEVMKTFNAMTAGVNGVITEICAENAQLVEYGQVLFRVRPS